MLYLKKKQNYNTFTIPCEISKMVSSASSIMKNIVVFLSRLRFTVKLICCIAFGSTLLFTKIYRYHLIENNF